MYMCYLDESGVQENTGTSHFVLLGLAVVAEQWKAIENQITQCKRNYGLADAEIHSAWVARRYIEEEQVPDFERLSWDDRRKATAAKRDQSLIRVAARGDAKQLKAAKLNYRKTNAYAHLAIKERRKLLHDLVGIIASWGVVRLFAEVLDKKHIYATVRHYSPFEFAFTELVQRYEYFLRNRGNFLNQTLNGFLIQDNNETIAKRLTSMMRRFHAQGTRWTGIDHIIETPLFVDSHLTSMVQMADLCAYATRRFFENNETELFNRIYPRFDRTNKGVVGVRHYTADGCACKVCHDHS
jgi:hypothetical protein